MMRMLLLLLVCGLSVADEQEGVATATGHGGLTIALDGRGTLSVLRWPGPGSPDQLGYTANASGNAPNGGRWFFAVDGQWGSFNDSHWTVTQRYDSENPAVMLTQAVHSERPWRIEQRVTVSQDNVLVIHLRLGGFEQPPRVAWRANLQPTTRHLPGMPIADGPLDALNDFAAFADSDAGVVYHFRPEHPGREEWDLAETLAPDHADPMSWSKFNPGVWIAIAGGPQVLHAECGIVSQDEAGWMAGDDLRPAAVGDAFSVLELSPRRVENHYEAWVVVAGGATWDDVRNLPGRWRDATLIERTLHTERMDAFPAIDLQKFPEPWRAPLDVAAHHLQTNYDAASRRFVEGPGVWPMQARDWPRYGARVTELLDDLDQPDAAERILAYYLDEVRLRERDGQPYGSLPESFYTDGMLASPAFLVDDRGPARLLSAVAHHLRPVDTQRGRSFAERHWKAIKAGADFLESWVDSRRRAPLWSKDPVGLSDPLTQQRLFDAFAGIHAAIELAKATDREVPKSWTRREKAHRELVEWVLTSPKAGWAPELAVLDCFHGLGERSLTAVQERLEADFAKEQTLTYEEAAHLLMQTAYFYRDYPYRLRVSESSFLELLRKCVWKNGDSLTPAPPATSTATMGVHSAILLRTAFDK